MGDAGWKAEILVSPYLCDTEQDPRILVAETQRRFGRMARVVIVKADQGKTSKDIEEISANINHQSSWPSDEQRRQI